MIKKILVGILIVVVGVGLYLYTRLDGIVKSAVETYGPRLTKTTVTLKAVHLSPFSGTGGIHGLVIGPPEGFTQPVLSLRSASLSIDPKSVFSGAIVVRSLTFDSPEIHYERRRSGDNLTALQKNVESAMPVSRQERPQEPQKPAQPKKLLLDHFAATGGKVFVDLYGAKAETNLPDVTLDGIGAPNGADPKDAVSAVLAALKREAVKAAESGAAAKGIQQGLQNVQQRLKTWKGIFHHK